MPTVIATLNFQDGYRYTDQKQNLPSQELQVDYQMELMVLLCLRTSVLILVLWPPTTVRNHRLLAQHVPAPNTEKYKQPRQTLHPNTS